MAKIRAALCGSVLLLCTLANIASSQTRELPKLQSHVYNETSLLSNDAVGELESKLVRLQDSLGVQIAVVLIDSLSGYEAPDMAAEIGWHHKIFGVARLGVVIVVSVNPRMTWIGTSPGMENVLTDSEARHIYEDVLRPGLRSGSYLAALRSTIDAIVIATDILPAAK